MHVSLHNIEKIKLKQPQESEGAVIARWRTLQVTDDRGVMVEINMFAEDLDKLKIEFE